MEQEVLVTSFIQVIIYLLPVIGIVWKLSSIVHQVNENKKSIEELEGKLRSTVDTIRREYTEVVHQVNLVSNNVTEVLTSLKHLKEDVGEVKSSIKEISREKR